MEHSLFWLKLEILSLQLELWWHFKTIVCKFYSVLWCLRWWWFLSQELKHLENVSMKYLQNKVWCKIRNNQLLLMCKEQFHLKVFPLVMETKKTWFYVILVLISILVKQLVLLVPLVVEKQQWSVCYQGYMMWHTDQ